MVCDEKELGMAGQDPYDALMARFRTWLFDLPEGETLQPMMTERFTPEEAAFLAAIPFLAHTLPQLADRMGRPAEALLADMQPYLEKGLIYEKESKVGALYSLSDQLFMFYRMPGWKGEDDDWNRRLAPLINQYYTQNYLHDFMGHPTKGLRAIPVAGTVPDTRQILPYEDVLAYVEQEDYHTVSTCACRHRHNLDPESEPCRHEMLNCLHFGKLGRYIVKYGMGKEITREETLEILKDAADAGLVHGISNSKKGMDTICNCCTCCCLFLENVRIDTGSPAGHQRSNYHVRVDHDTCKACGLCETRCPVDAITLVDKADAPAAAEGVKRKPADLKTVAYDADRCIGCGVCVHKCPTRSLSLVRRDTPEEDIPNAPRDLGTRMITERGRDFGQVF
jgi:H+/Na+-translocating ferredoxin:NAD+ oxidoreductase subunit B